MIRLFNLFKEIIVPVQSFERAVKEKNNDYFASLLRYNFASQFISNDMVVLDCGCGRNYGNIILAKKAKLVEGVDCDFTIARSMERVSKGNFHFVNMDIHNIAYKNRTFDFVCAFEIIEHLDCPTKMIKEIIRVLKSKGRFILSVPNIGYWSKDIFRNPFHKREYTFKELVNFIESFFKIIFIKGIFLESKQFEQTSIFKHYIKIKKKLGFINWQINPQIRYKFFKPKFNIHSLDCNNKEPNYFLILCQKK